MATFKVYKLHFTTPVHFGDGRNDYGVSLQTIQSDTMYAALTSCLAKLGVDIPVGGDLGFTISSLFPYYQKGREDKPIFFLPKPLKNNLLDVKDIEHRKKIKKVCWLDIEYFEKMISGIVFESSLQNIHGKYMTNAMIDEDFIQNQIQERVIVSRTGQEDARPFYMDRATFAGYSGLYFLVEGNTKLLDKAITLLKDEGIGTDRNVGNGLFEYDVDKVEIKSPVNAIGQMALSMYLPQSKEELDAMVDSSNIAYDFSRRGGWITTYPHNMLRKNYVYAFMPASVFAAYKPSDTKGRIVDLGEDVPGLQHPIYRCGKSLFIPVNV